MEQSLRVRRSFIFAPGTRPDMFSKALACGADMICVDLEDGVAPAEKDSARSLALEHFPTAAGPSRVERIIRLNCLRTKDGLRDVLAVLESPRPVQAIMLAKVKGPEEVRNLSELFEQNDIQTRLHVIIETTQALEAVSEIAVACDRIEALFFGGVDMAADLRCGSSWAALQYARARVVHAAASAGIDAIDVPYLDLNDQEGMLAEARQAAELGFTGKGAIHPKQIADINGAFTPSAEAVSQARKVLNAFKESGKGLLVVDGKLIEKPVLRSYLRLLAVYEASGQSAS